MSSRMGKKYRLPVMDELSLGLFLAEEKDGYYAGKSRICRLPRYDYLEIRHYWRHEGSVDAYRIQIWIVP